MLELTQSQKATPRLIAAELQTARRIMSNLTAQADRHAVENYIEELEQELARLDWDMRRVA